MAASAPSTRSLSAFERLPAELYDEIFSYLPCLCTYHEERVVQHVYNDYEMHQFDYLKGVGRSDFGFELPGSTLKLRLVSRAFNRAARRVWFQHESLKFRAYDYKGLFENPELEKPGNHEVRIITPNSVDRINDLVLQSASLAPHLRRIRIELSHGESWPFNGVAHWMDPQGKPLTGQDEIQTLHRFVKLIPVAIEKMEKLECLSMYMSATWESDYSGDSRVDSAPQFNLVALDELRNSLTSLFSSSSNRLQFLTDLRLSLLTTHDFSALNAAMSDEATARLRHLYLEYCDASGPGGDRSYLVYADDDEGDDGDEYVPLSNLQEQYPNEQYMLDVCTLVGRCHNLESLGLHATHYLDLDTLDWQPSGKGLQNLYIYRAIVHSNTLKKLLSASDGTTSSTVALHLNYVQLLDSTWTDVFDHLFAADTMKYFGISDLNYAHRGESAHLRRFNNRQYENSSSIWSEYEEDESRLEGLIAKVLDGGGLISQHLDYMVDSSNRSQVAQW